MKKTILLKLDEIARLKEARGIRSQAELARKSGWSPNHMSQVFREIRMGLTPSLTLSKVAGLCEALSATIIEIVEMKEAPEACDILGLLPEDLA